MKLKNKVFILFCLTILGCINSKDSSEKESTYNHKVGQQVEDLFFYLEFVDLDGSSTYKNSIQLVKKELLANGYIATKERNNDWKGIRKIDQSEQITPDDLDEYNHYIHRFKNFSEYTPSDSDIEKIVITMNKPIDGSISNFNYRSYKKLGYEEWQSVFNPGNFRYPENEIFDEKEFSNWMIETIVLLTFK